MTWLICLLRGHLWFSTVKTHASYVAWWGGELEDEIHHLGEFDERICLRCQKNEAVHVRDLAYYDPYPGPHWESQEQPAWVGQPPQHFALQGDWSST